MLYYWLIPFIDRVVTVDISTIIAMLPVELLQAARKIAGLPVKDG